MSFLACSICPKINYVRYNTVFCLFSDQKRCCSPVATCLRSFYILSEIFAIEMKEKSYRCLYTNVTDKRCYIYTNVCKDFRLCDIERFTFHWKHGLFCLILRCSGQCTWVEQIDDKAKITTIGLMIKCYSFCPVTIMHLLLKYVFLWNECSSSLSVVAFSCSFYSVASSRSQECDGAILHC